MDKKTFSSEHSSFKEDKASEENVSAMVTGDNDTLSALENTTKEESLVSVEDHLKEEVAGLKDQLLRALAETENIRKRSIREQDEARKYAVTQFARDLLSVSDNLSRALESIPEDSLKASPLLETVVSGVTMTQNELLSIFERQNIRKIPALGEKFNPHLHQAMLEVEGDGEKIGQVIQVLQEGYQIHDRLLRPSLVSVGKAAQTAKD